jgi:hypothetical protein
MHGGSHYHPGTKFQHWDWTIQVLCNSYLEGSFTAYTARHRFKGTPRLDLQKALHYTQKTIEAFDAGLITAMFHLRSETNEFCVLKTDEFCRGAQLNDAESVIMHRAASWRTREDLLEIARRIQELMDNLKEGDDVKQASA